MIIPVFIVVSLSVVEGLPWIADQSEKGSLSEATDYNNIGRRWMKDGSYQDAYLQFSHAIRIKPDYAEAYMNMGILYHMTKRDKEAITYLKKAISLNPDKKEIIYNNLGMIYFEQGKYNDALEMFQIAAKLGIRMAKLQRNIGMVEMQRGNYTGAVDAYTKAIEDKPTLHNLYTNMLKETLGDPNNESYLHDVQAHLDRGVTVDDLAFYDSVIVNILLNKNAKLADDYVDCGLAYEKNGQLDFAITQFRKALGIQTKRVSLLNRIGILNAKQGRFEDAEKSFLKALKIDPNNAGARKALKKLYSQN